ncbi:single-stranded DNA-binding protein [Caproiciproducens galactitolivorans]|uniref:Single-stranded DNA-binding protein n=1 Tax=Caproiciproducens galactitolivorans TaxID=642589 RepID=A0ABT4BWD2_9FIRM|nr:single-stranded DNA-binding protein [Caproiciproducens galactitolivorans]MCY1715199.1 single-stranded DNA-binding protein [Caproiciproducens galactitolivorans]
MLNVAVLMGRLCADPEPKVTPNGISVTSFTLAVDRSYQKSGQDRQCDFIDIVAWRSTADFVCKYFTKGQLIAVQGSIQTRTYTDKDGNKRKAFEVVADNVHFAEPKRDGNSRNGNKSTYKADVEPPAPQYPTGDTGDFEEIPSSDDLPF